MSEASLKRCDPDEASVLTAKIMSVSTDFQVIDAISAAHSVVCHLICVASPSLQEALGNAERLHADMQEALRKRLGN